MQNVFLPSNFEKKNETKGNSNLQRQFHINKYNLLVYKYEYKNDPWNRQCIWYPIKDIKG